MVQGNEEGDLLWLLENLCCCRLVEVEVVERVVWDSEVDSFMLG